MGTTHKFIIKVNHSIARVKVWSVPNMMDKGKMGIKREIEWLKLDVKFV